MSRPDLRRMPISEALHVLQEWLDPKIPPKVRQPNEKVSDATLVSIAVLQKIHHQLYFGCWWRFVKLNFCVHLPSLTQASVRLNRLLPTVEAVCVEVEDLDFCLIDSLPLPVCRSKRASRCKVREATMGFGIQGSVDGFKCHAWSKLNGTLAQYVIRPANQHDLIAGYDLNADWVAYGAPRIIGDKADLDRVNLTPPKKNARTLDPRWKKEYGAARKMIETVFPHWRALVFAGDRSKCSPYSALRWL